MLLASNGVIPSQEWEHNPNIQNKYECTVACYLKKNHLPIPNEWYDYTMKYIPK